jgi:hypothetical protein
MSNAHQRVSGGPGARLRMTALCFSLLCGSTAYAGDSFVAGAPVPGTDGGYYALPRVVVPVEVSRTKCELKVTAHAPLFLPDSAARFRLRIDHDILSSETLKVTTNERGLLTAVNGEAQDQTGEVLKQLVHLYSTLSGAKPTRQNNEQDDCAKSNKNDFAYAGLLDPTNTDTRLNSEAKEFLERYRVKMEIGGLLDGDNKATGNRMPPTDCSEVVCFRAVRPYLVKFTQERSDTIGLPDQVFTLSVIAPDPATVMGIRLDRQLFAKSDIKLSFSEGILTKFDTSRESEAVSVLKLPLDVAKEILKVPGDLATVRVKEIQSDTSLLQEQQKLIRAQIALIEAQQAAIQASKPSPPPPPQATGQNSQP